MTAVSPRAGLVFADNEKVDVRVQVTGAGGPVEVEYEVKETEGSWTAKKKLGVAVKGGAGTAAVPLELPGRGHYEMTLTAVGGGQTANATTAIGVVFPPSKAEEASSWGIFYTPPSWFGRKDHVVAAEESAASLRILGASWIRFNFYAGDYRDVQIEKKGGKVFVTADTGLSKTYIQALRRKGLFIMGEVCQVPTALSSRPEEEGKVADAGELRNRVKPRSYAEWDSLMTNLAGEYKKDIGVWEIWNEANYTERGYWSGTLDELLELVEHTSKALSPTSAVRP